MSKMTVAKKTLVMLLVSCVFLAGCGSKGEHALKEVEKLKAENEELKRSVEEMKDQTKLEQVKNLEGYSKEDLQKLQEEFEKLMLHPRTYEPKDIVALFYYICGNTDVIKKIYDDGNLILAEAIIEMHMSWSGQFKVIRDFIKTWVATTNEETSQWNNMIYSKCVEAFYIFKYYPADYEMAKQTLPANFISEIVSIHEKQELFPEGYTKANYN